jgi:alkyl hydroperoxide reductase subunit AhpC
MVIISEILLILKEGEIEVIEEDMEEIERAENYMEEKEETMKDLEVIEEKGMIEVMVILKEEMKEKMVDVIKKIPTGRMMLLNL